MTANDEMRLLCGMKSTLNDADLSIGCSSWVEGSSISLLDVVGAVVVVVVAVAVVVFVVVVFLLHLFPILLFPLLPDAPGGQKDTSTMVQYATTIFLS